MLEAILDSHHPELCQTTDHPELCQTTACCHLPSAFFGRAEAKSANRLTLFLAFNDHTLLPSAMFSMLRSCRCLPSTSTLASVSVPQQQQQLVRSLATSTRSSAASTSNKPKRDETTYGLPPSIPRADWPLEKDTDTRAHPLWRFFHDKESLEVPDKRKDNSSTLFFRFRCCRSLWPRWPLLPCHATVNEHVQMVSDDV